MFVTTTMRLQFCISDGDKQVVHGDMVIVIPGFHLYFTTVIKTKLMFSVDKNPLGPYNDPLFKNCFKYGR